MEFELIVRCGDDSFSEVVTIKDWNTVKDQATAEMKLKQAFGPMYNDVIGNLVKKILNKGDKKDG